MTQAENSGLQQQMERLIRDISAVTSCPKKTSHVVAYLRCAVKDEKDAADQLAEIQRYVENRGWELADVYLDNGYSGHSDQRPALVRLQQDVQDGRADVVVVSNLARLFRNLFGLQRFMQLLWNHQVGLVCLR